MEGKPIKTLIFYLFMATAVILLPVLFLVSFIVRCLLVLVIRGNPDYGKMLSYSDALVDENFVETPPKGNLVAVLSLEGKGVLSIQEFRKIFRKHVLDATLPCHPSSSESEESTKARYPELKQYIATKWGFRVWKSELDFRIEEHICERSMEHLDLSKIHEELTNRPFRKWRSPWEFQLIREENSTPSKKYFLALKIHHSMADARSILKIVVECLGQKKLKTVEPQEIEQSSTEKFLYYLMFPLNYIRFVCRLAWYALKSHGHPWKTWMNDHEDPTDDNVPLVVRLSPKLSLTEVKQVAKQNEVLASSVILSVISGAIGKYDLRGDEVFVGFSQPKENHPNILTNHWHSGVVMVPTTPSTDINAAVSRLKLCHARLLEMKRGNWVKYSGFAFCLIGNFFHSWQRVVGVNYYGPVGITNIAGDLEGFSVGRMSCSEFTMSVGTLKGCAGVAICILSYMDAISVAVAAKETVMSGERAEQFADEISKELEVLSSKSIAN